MTDSEIVVRRLLEYRDGPPERVCAETPDGDGIVGRFYTMWDILEIIMHPKCEFTTYELLTRLAELMDAPSKGTCHIEERYGNWYCTGCGEMVGTCDVTSELCIDGNAIDLWRHCPRCGRRIEVDA